MRSQLTKYQPKNPATQEELRKMRAAAWHKQFILVVPMDDPALVIDDIHRQALINVGSKLYGVRA